MADPDRQRIVTEYMQLSAQYADLQQRLRMEPGNQALQQQAASALAALNDLVAQNPWLQGGGGAQGVPAAGQGVSRGGLAYINQDGTTGGVGLGGGGTGSVYDLVRQDPYYLLAQRNQELAESKFGWDRYKWERERLDAQAKLDAETQAAWSRFAQRAGLGIEQALYPYVVAPGTQYIPGYEPGGIMQSIYEGWGRPYNPELWRTMQVGGQTIAPPGATAALPSWAPKG